MSESADVHELASGNWLQVSDGFEALRIATRKSDWDIDSANGCYYARRQVGDVLEQLYVCPTSPDAESHALGWEIKPATREIVLIVLIICACLTASIVVPLVLCACWWTILIAVVGVLVLPSTLLRLTLGGRFREEQAAQERMKDWLSKSLDGESIEWSLGASTVASVQLQELVISVSAIESMCESAERHYAKNDTGMGDMYLKMAKDQSKQSGLLPESAVFARVGSVASRPSNR